MLENHAVLIGWVGIAAEAEVAQTVYDVAAVVFLVSLYYVRMRPDNKIGSFVDSNVPQLDLRFVGDRFLFGAPMEIDGNELGSIFLGGFDVLLEFVLDIEMFRQFVGSDKCHLHAVDITIIDAIVAKGSDSRVFQGGNGVGVALLAVIARVVVGKRCRFDVAFHKDLCVIGRAFEGEGLVLARGGGC